MGKKVRMKPLICHIDDNDINELSNLSEEKKNKIKEYVSNKINQQVERNTNGAKES